MNELSFIRKNLRSKRRSLTQFEQKQAQLNVLHYLNRLPIFHSSKKLAYIYMLSVKFILILLSNSALKITKKSIYL